MSITHVSRFNSGAGHYTQVVWADTEELGCGMVYYKSNTDYETLTVCNYAMGGNIQGLGIRLHFANNMYILWKLIEVFC